MGVLAQLEQKSARMYYCKLETMFVKAQYVIYVAILILRTCH